MGNQQGRWGTFGRKIGRLRHLCFCCEEKNAWEVNVEGGYFWQDGKQGVEAFILKLRDDKIEILKRESDKTHDTRRQKRDMEKRKFWGRFYEGVRGGGGERKNGERREWGEGRMGIEKEGVWGGVGENGERRMGKEEERSEEKCGENGGEERVRKEERGEGRCGEWGVSSMG